jgi:hypothetical protein
VFNIPYGKVFNIPYGKVFNIPYGNVFNIPWHIWSSFNSMPGGHEHLYPIFLSVHVWLHTRCGYRHSFKTVKLEKK